MISPDFLISLEILDSLSRYHPKGMNLKINKQIRFQLHNKSFSFESFCRRIMPDESNSEILCWPAVGGEKKKKKKKESQI